MKTPRYIQIAIKESLKTRMVFIGGPRQVGKTTLSLQFLSTQSPKHPNYLNWDDVNDQKKILKYEFPQEGLLVLDEIHKYKKWRSLVKGLFDKNKDDMNFIVTGSARLDHFRKGGDSLLGRYRYYRLHPFTVSELNLSATDVKDLIQFGGFPEPYFAQNEKNHKLWLNERAYRIVNDDIRDLTTIKETSLISLLVELLPSRVGSLLSLRSLAEDLSVSQPSIDRWITELDNIYYSYRISPFGSPKVRAIKKMQKLYLWDWSEIESPGARFENFVASHLLKYAHYLEDTEGDRYEIRYLRDTLGHEVDFVFIKNKKPLWAVECKTGEGSLSKSIGYFREKLDIPEYYQVHLGKKDFGSSKSGRVLPFSVFCKEMGLV